MLVTMFKHVSLPVLVVVLEVWNVGLVQGHVEQNEDGTGVISFQTPTLNDEEWHSLYMPKHLKCDACMAIAYSLKTKFEAAHKKRPSLKKFPEADVIEFAEEVCADKFENYGIKQVKKKKRLSGPGLEAESSPGVMEGGGKWPTRLQIVCNRYVEEFGDERLYKYWLQYKELGDYMCKNRVIYPGLTDVCFLNETTGDDVFKYQSKHENKPGEKKLHLRKDRDKQDKEFHFNEKYKSMPKPDIKVETVRHPPPEPAEKPDIQSDKVNDKSKPPEKSKSETPEKQAPKPPEMPKSKSTDNPKPAQPKMPTAKPPETPPKDEFENIKKSKKFKSMHGSEKMKDEL